MKKLLTIVVVAMATLGAKAQEMEGFIFKAGLNFNKMENKVTSSNNKSNLGFHLGAAYEYPIYEGVFVEGGLYFDTRGNKYVQNDKDVNGTSTLTFFSLNAPVTLKAKLEIADDIRVFGQMGPYLDILLWGVATANFYDKNTKESETRKTVIHISDEEKYTENVVHLDIERLGYGLTFGGGVEYQNFVFGLSYDLGLNNHIKDKFSDEEKLHMHMHSFKLSVGYKF